MARPRCEGVRRDLILATFDSVAKHGVDRTSLRDIAKATGLSNGTVTYHFPTKQSLLRSAIGYGFLRTPDGYESADAETALDWVVSRYVLSTSRRRSWWQFWLAVTFYAQSDNEVRDRVAEHQSLIIDRWRSYLERRELAETGELSGKAQERARQLAAYAHGMAIHQLIEPSQTEWAETVIRRVAAEPGRYVDLVEGAPAR
jgi:AcrR family transcriptional regulator